MKSDQILKADLLDLVFDNRNKNYGAYELRKNYRKRLWKAIFVGFVFAAGFSSLILMAKKEKKLVAPDTILVNIFDEAIPAPKDPPKEKIVKPPVPKAPVAPAKQVAQQQFTSDIAIVDDASRVTKLPTNLDDLAIGSSTRTGEPGAGRVEVPDPVVIDGNGDVKPVAAVDKETPRLTADVMPAFPGGTEALRNFMARNLHSPEDLEEGQVITVRVKFIVGYDGKLKGFEILEDGGAAFNREVIRVLKKMPEWIPGRSNGENVSVFFTIPVKFTPAF